jgi:tetratricopeptide (TPR) repeat protein
LSHVGLVETLQALEDQETIVELLRSSLVQMPEHDERAWWQRQLGLALEKLERWPEALQTYRTATAESPENPLLRLALAHAIYEVEGDFDTAWDEIQEAIALEPEEAAGYFAAGELLVLEERLAEADAWFVRALELNPDNRQQLLTRANVARDADNLPLAIDLYDLLLQNYPDNAGVFYEAAWGYQLAGQPDRAIEAIERAIELDDRSLASFHIRAGQIYEWTRDFERALQAYEAALALAPANRQAQRGLERLQEKE